MRTYFVQQMRSQTGFELMSQFAAYLYLSRLVSPSSLSCLPVFYKHLGQPFVDMLGVFRCTEHLSARIIAHKPYPR